MDLDELYTQYFQLGVTRYISIAGGVMAVYDQILNFPDELELIWMAEFSPVKFIYLFNRFSLPIILAIHHYEVSGLGYVTDQWCKAWLVLEAAWTFLCLMLIHWLMMVRVWVFAGRQKNTFIYLTLSFVICFLIVIGVLSAGMVFMVPASTPSHIMPLCTNILPPFMIAIWFPFAIFQIFLFILTGIKYRQHAIQSDASPVPIIERLWRDGYIFFLVIAVTVFFNIAVWIGAPIGLKLLARHFCFACEVVAASHLILSIRRIGRHLKTPDSLTLTRFTRTGIEWDNEMRNQLSTPVETRIEDFTPGQETGPEIFELSQTRSNRVRPESVTS